MAAGGLRLACQHVHLVSSAVSAAAGWSRGGTAVNAAFWACLGLLTTAAAHLLPATSRLGKWHVRLMAWLLWLGCIVFVVLSHASYFLGSQQARGEQRAGAMDGPVATAFRPLSAVMAARANLESEETALRTMDCSPACSTARRKIAVLLARMAALDQGRRS